MATCVELSKLLPSSDPSSPIIKLEKKVNKLIRMCQKDTEDDDEFDDAFQSMNDAIDTFFKGDYIWSISIEDDKRQHFFKVIHDTLKLLHPCLEKHLPEKLNEHENQMLALRLLCDPDSDPKPLSFVGKCRENMNLWNDYEKEIVSLIDNLNQKLGSEKILINHLDAIKNGRKKVVIAFLGSLKATKSSFVNLLLQQEICPTGNEATTARLTKITYGNRIALRVRTNQKQSALIYCKNYKELLEVATNHIKLPSDKRSIECKDEIIIELPVGALRDVELWDIPGFDENEVMDNRITEIIADTDLIFALMSHEDSVKNSFQSFVQPRLPKQENDDNNYEPIGKAQTAMICFIITRIDTFKINIQTNKTRGVVLDDLYNTLQSQLGIKFDSIDWKSCNNFIPMCTHLRFGIKTFLECRQMFLEKSYQWFTNAVQRLADFRLSYLLNIMQQFFDYAEMKQKIQHCKELKRTITKFFLDFESKIPDFVTETLRPVEQDALSSIRNAIKEYNTSEYRNDSSRPNKIDDIIKEKIVEKYMDSLKQKGESIREGIQKLLGKYESSLQLNPAEFQLYEEIVADIDLNPYRLGVGYFENARTLGATTDIVMHGSNILYLSGFGSLFVATLVIDTLPVTGPILVLGGILGLIQGPITQSIVNSINSIGWYFNAATTARLEEAMQLCVKEVNKALHEQLADTIMRFSKSRLTAIIKNIDERTKKFESFKSGQIQILVKFIDENRLKSTKLYLDLLSEQFERMYPDCQITDQNLSAGSIEIFPGILILSDAMKCDLIAKKVRLNEFNIKEIRYLKQLNHPNIVKYHGISKCTSIEDFYYIIMDRMDGNVTTYLRLQQRSSTMSEDKLLGIIDQITLALCYIHKKNLIHRTLKPENILFKKVDECTMFYLGDIGCIHRDPGKPYGTSKYMAPEYSNSSLGPITDKADVYSWGMVIEELLNYIPRDNVQNSAILEKWLAIAKECTSTPLSTRPSCAQIVRKTQLTN